MNQPKTPLVGTIVAIRTGSRESSQHYDVIQAQSLDGGWVRIAPRDPADLRDPWWMSAGSVVDIMAGVDYGAMAGDGARVIDGERFPLIRHASANCYNPDTDATRWRHDRCSGELTPLHVGDPTVCVCPCHDRRRRAPLTWETATG